MNGLSKCFQGIGIGISIHSLCSLHFSDFFFSENNIIKMENIETLDFNTE